MPENKGGRPKLPVGEARSVTLKIRVTPAERQTLEKAAARSLAGITTFSSWAREVLLFEAAKIGANFVTKAAAPKPSSKRRPAESAPKLTRIICRHCPHNDLHHRADGYRACEVPGCDCCEFSPGLPE